MTGVCHGTCRRTIHRLHQFGGVAAQCVHSAHRNGGVPQVWLLVTTLSRPAAGRFNVVIWSHNCDPAAHLWHSMLAPTLWAHRACTMQQPPQEHTGKPTA
eukprot:CAMPEP_0174378484 /NCGR_PEP_ID=MMETSP0811_2-20130205/122079_1 /TAXON_ID=73025 ORGANISM="Eutreptiella gymnastica-like, Strain CCMP1594" /NCGR_SAMPLE_ID=MMETSP0811_2 /ASSEMBLY_ACC=CAM_ASM_000667 /LENGTH=99 /DNA_ID=CAMNT_0015530711 /DNA_START=251 /DNA_END=550 /DNA_ORIENTATION=-